MSLAGKWSTHVGPLVGKNRCDVAHVGLVLAGRATAAMNDGRVVEMKADDVFYIAPGHDSWVVGDEPYVSIHLMGAGDYAHGEPSTQKCGFRFDPAEPKGLHLRTEAAQDCYFHSFRAQIAIVSNRLCISRRRV